MACIVNLPASCISCTACTFLLLFGTDSTGWQGGTRYREEF
uniref:Uncharacterized protein n=1 Tax=Arundo donax TaxID=35708 RepID=A0A0A9EPC1_ARUDO